ncbi:H+/oligopeptide symporter [Handroanthus impetiginosus]|uniref:H+/oligopeptide symporter n=1 Tax=Handroanthus impetiginosus TaxID=429701 RepID=A0A2G9HNL1_9LAMI|nr:H+/oligopeptide symporter [Handroanthus impetiginosus]
MGFFGNAKPEQQLKKGGRRATALIFGLETMTFISNGVSLFTYFHGYMNFSLTKSATALTNYMGTAFLLPLFAGFISDTYLSRFKTCVIFGCLEVMGYALLAIQAHLKQLRPFPCKDIVTSTANKCESATSSQEAMLFMSLYLVALGTGGIKAALPSLGADQLNDRDPKEAASLSSYFNWYMFFLNLGAIFGVTFVVWINTNQGWDWAFSVCSMAMAVAVLLLSMGHSVYRNNLPMGSPLTRSLQVFVAAIRNRNLPLPANADELHEVHDKEAEQNEILQRTNQFRFLDHAAIVTCSEDTTSSTAGGTWKICTVTQVEETKILVRMLPIILSTVFMNTCLAQLQTFSIQQSTTTNRKIGSFEMPASSIPVIPLTFIFVPLARKFTGIPTGITQLQRVGVGLVLSAISMAVSGIIETHRKKVAIKHAKLDSSGPLPISVFWIGIQYAIFGIADIFTLVGLLEFFYAESSSKMKSLGTAISWCSFAFGY